MTKQNAVRTASALAITVGVAAALLGASATAADLESRTSSVAGVTVKVTPGSLAPAASIWEFVVVLDTHSQDLSDDLSKIAVLIDATGRRYAPVAWDGAPSGGHHREGTLRFTAVSPAPDAIELQIARPAETKARIFRWQLK